MPFLASRQELCFGFSSVRANFIDCCQTFAFSFERLGVRRLFYLGVIFTSFGRAYGREELTGCIT